MPLLRIMSDLHLEFSGVKFDHIWSPKVEDKNQILLLAGDIGNGMQVQPFIENLCKHFKYVIYTCGNHEFWAQEDFYKTIAQWETRGPSNFYFLYNKSVIIDDVKFIGGTMWTSFNNGDRISISRAHSIMNDFAYITSNGRNITPEFIITEHKNFIKFLISEWEKSFSGKVVVMTHHSPGNELRRCGYSSRVGSAYFADLEQMIGSYNRAQLWVHGHTHQTWDYMINETRVICNPYGYHNHETNDDFNPNLVIEI